MRRDVCVIGAGVAGLAAAKFLSPHFNVTVFERSHSVGGVWLYNKGDTNTTHVTPMYKNLKTNLPNHLMSFSDHSHPDGSPSFLTHQQTLDYLEGYCDKFGLRELIKFGTAVTMVKPIGNGEWSVSTDDGETRHYGAVAVASGKYDSPDIPSIPGLCTLPRYEHSKSYGDPTAYTGQHVLVVGARASGVDIVIDLALAGVRVDVAHRAADPKQGLPPGVEQLGEPLRVEDGVTFFRGREDGIRFDTVIFATGYGTNLDYLGTECGLERDVLPRPLYRYLINPSHPTMGVFAQCSEIAPFLMAEYQARYFTATLTGQIKLPDPEELAMAAWRTWNEKGEEVPTKYRYNMNLAQFQYYKELAGELGLTPPPHHLDALCDLYGFVAGGRRSRPTVYRQAEYEFSETSKVYVQVRGET